MTESSIKSNKITSITKFGYIRSQIFVNPARSNIPEFCDTCNFIWFNWGLGHFSMLIIVILTGFNECYVKVRLNKIKFQTWSMLAKKIYVSTYIGCSLLSKMWMCHLATHLSFRTCLTLALVGGSNGPPMVFRPVDRRETYSNLALINLTHTVKISSWCHVRSSSYDVIGQVMFGRNRQILRSVAQWCAFLLSSVWVCIPWEFMVFMNV